MSGSDSDSSSASLTKYMRAPTEAELDEVVHAVSDTLAAANIHHAFCGGLWRVKNHAAGTVVSTRVSQYL